MIKGWDSDGRNAVRAEVLPFRARRGRPGLGKDGHDSLRDHHFLGRFLGRPGFILLDRSARGPGERNHPPGTAPAFLGDPGKICC